MVITRGRNKEEAEIFFNKVCKEKVEFVSFCNIDSAFLYSKGHPFNWLDTAPLWLNIRTKFEPTDFNFKNRFYKT